MKLLTWQTGYLTCSCRVERTALDLFDTLADIERKFYVSICDIICLLAVHDTLIFEI